MAKHEHRVEVISFDGADPILVRAQEEAVRKLQEWYQEQQILFHGDGSSVFQFSTVACLIPVVNEPPYFIFTITVFDTRRAWDKEDD